MTKTNDYDVKGWEAVKAEAKELESQRGILITRFEEIEKIYFMDWKSNSITETISPDGRNKVNGAVMILTAAGPTWDVPQDKNNPDAERLSSRMEKAANQMWNASNRAQSNRVETDLAFSAFMYDEMTARVTSTQDMLDAIKEAAKEAEGEEGYNETYWKAEIEHAERRAEATPYLFEALYPKIAHPLYSRSELLALYTKTEMRVADVRKDYGERAVKALIGKKDYTSVDVCEWYDKSYRYTWIDGTKEPIFAEPHGLGFLPAASVKVKGRRFYDKAERRNEPFLFSVLTSGIWPLQNAILTAIATNVTSLINAGFVFKPESPEAELSTIHHEIIGNVVRVPGTLAPLSKELISSDTMELYRLINTIMENSTISGQALGSQMNATMAFSLASMLAQAGRLPIIPTQKAMETILAQLMEIAFRWWKQEGKTFAYVSNFKPADIPNVVSFDVTVEPDLPQDKVQMAGVVSNLTGGEDPILPKRWGREFMGEGQSDEIQAEIWTERTANAAFAIGQQMILEMLKQPQQPPSGAPQMGERNLGGEMGEGMPQGGPGMPRAPMTSAPMMQPETPEGVMERGMNAPEPPLG